MLTKESRFGTAPGASPSRCVLPAPGHAAAPSSRAVFEPVAQPAGDHAEEEIVDRHPFARSVRSRSTASSGWSTNAT